MLANQMLNGLVYRVKIIVDRSLYPVYYETENYGLTHIIAIAFGESEKDIIRLQQMGEILKNAEVREIEYHGEM